MVDPVMYACGGCSAEFRTESALVEHYRLVHDASLTNTGPPRHDPVNHPPHYTSHPSGIECIQITEHFNFNLGNAIKYIWRSGEKGSQVEDLKKARWYLDREIKRLET